MITAQAVSVSRVMKYVHTASQGKREINNVRAKQELDIAEQNRRLIELDKAADEFRSTRKSEEFNKIDQTCRALAVQLMASNPLPSVKFEEGTTEETKKIADQLNKVIEDGRKAIEEMANGKASELRDRLEREALDKIEEETENFRKATTKNIVGKVQSINTIADRDCRKITQVIETDRIGMAVRKTTSLVVKENGDLVISDNPLGKEPKQVTIPMDNVEFVLSFINKNYTKE